MKRIIVYSNSSFSLNGQLERSDEPSQAKDYQMLNPTKINCCH